MSDKDYDVELNEELKDNKEELSGVAWQNRSRKGEPIFDMKALFEYIKKHPGKSDYIEEAKQFIIGYEE